MKTKVRRRLVLLKKWMEQKIKEAKFGPHSIDGSIKHTYIFLNLGSFICFVFFFHFFNFIFSITEHQNWPELGTFHYRAKRKCDRNEIDN